MGFTVPCNYNARYFDLSHRCRNIMRGKVSDVRVIPRYQGAEAILVYLIFCPLKPFVSEAVIVDSFFVIDCRFPKRHFFQLLVMV